MFKNIVRLFFLFLLASIIGSAYATVFPDLKEVDTREVGGDSLNFEKENPVLKKRSVKIDAVAKKDSSDHAFYEYEEDVEEDTTSNSALSFNFIYYIIEKFKLQVE